MSHPRAASEKAPPLATNPLGFAGFLLVLLGLIFTCGVLSPIGLLMSVAALFKRPKGYAIAGTILGLCVLPFSLLFIFAYSSIFAWFGYRIDAALDLSTTQSTMQKAVARIEAKAVNGNYPEASIGQAAIDDLNDAWDRPLSYRPEEDSYVLASAGADGEHQTVDDILLTRYGLSTHLESIPTEVVEWDDGGEFEYRLVQRLTAFNWNKSKVVALPIDNSPPAEEALTTLAKSLESDQHRYTFIEFYFPEMNIEKHPWAKAKYDRDDEQPHFSLVVYDKWLPARYRDSPATTATPVDDASGEPTPPSERQGGDETIVADEVEATGQDSP